MFFFLLLLVFTGVLLCLKWRRKTLPRRAVFSFAAKTNGLRGESISIAALVYDEGGMEMARFLGEYPKNYQDYDALLRAFATFYLANKKGVDLVVHMGYIAEARLLRDMHDRGLIGDWDAPYPLYDVSGTLQAAGEDPTFVEKYLKRHGLSVDDFGGGAHNPLYDCAATAAAYRHLNRWK